ncbi:hypothetical protein LB535_17300, partial [Mesorhizobium sp. CA10]|uniref:hypothetical protein n=1 Tax=Mesorhizobium sp. CA10 TaxID=588495 RepID=UPI001CCEB8CB
MAETRNGDRHSRAEQERSSVAKTLESIPLPSPGSATEQNLHRSNASKVTAWQLCSRECGFVANDSVEDDQELP